MFSLAAARRVWNSCLLALVCVWGGGSGMEGFVQPLPSLTLPQRASGGCSRKRNVNTCSRLSFAPKTMAKSELGRGPASSGRFQKRECAQASGKSASLPWEPRSKRNSRSTAVTECPCISHPNSQTFDPLHCSEYTCPLVGKDVLFNSSACWDTNI